MFAACACFPLRPFAQCSYEGAVPFRSGICFACMSGQLYKPTWFDTAVRVQCLDQPAHVKLKAASFPTAGEVYWVLDGLFDYLLYKVRDKAVSTSHEIRKWSDTWKLWCLVVGFDFDSMLVRSLRSSSARTGEAIPDHASDDAKMKTWGVILKLTMWGSQRRSPLCRSKGEKLLATMLASTLPDDESKECLHDILSMDEGFLGKKQ